MSRMLVLFKVAALVLVTLAASVAPAAAQSVPQSVKIQGYLSDRTGGTPVPANGIYSMTFEIFDAPAGGVALSTTGPVPVTVTNGVYEASIAAGATVFAGSSRYLQVTVNSEVLSPRLPIDSTPFALRSESAVNAETVAPGSVDAAGLAPGAVTPPALADGAVTAPKIGVPCAEGQILLRAGGMWTCGILPGIPTVCPDGSFLYCYPGPMNTLDVGLCQAGVSACKPDRTGFADCAGAVTPVAETCDTLDNDCDGQVDDGVCGTCGNAIVEQGEGCDDGDALSGDGCSATCQVEPGYQCTGQPSVCTPAVVCGDGIIQAGEGCDDGDALSGDGCSSICQVEVGYQCVGQPSVCTSTSVAAPTVSTFTPSGVTGNGATLNGSGNPNGAATTGWFRYSTTSPGACSDSFGTRVPSIGGAGLGAGTTAVVYAQAVTGLSPSTTYHLCAIASNSQGTAFGAVVSFTTPATPPTVSTSAATLVGSNSATLNGSGNPNGASATGWFRYATTDPGTCNDVFGTRAPTSSVSDSVLGSGTSAVAYSHAITGLAPGTTYYFCAIAANSEGTSFGAVVSFTTPASPPTVTTSAATLVTASGATLNGSGNPGGAATTGWFRYSTTNPGACDDTFGTRAPASGGASLGSGTSAVAYAQTVTGLSPVTTYYVCAIASNAEGTAFGAVLSFTTPAGPPTVTTSAATLVTSSGATLNGSGNPNGAATTGWFRYATTNPGTCDDTFGTRAPVSSASDSVLGSGTSPVAYSWGITGLVPNTTYYFCAIAANSLGTSFGTVRSFTTPASAPTVTTLAATLVTTTGATLNGSGNPNGAATTGWFRYSTTNPVFCNDSFGTRAPASGGSSLGSGSSGVAYAQSVAGLAVATTYYFCAIASNTEGTSFGVVRSFTTWSAPTVSTSAATGVTSSAATLNGSANPNGAFTTGWFRYATTNPGTCDDTFGTRAPASGDAFGGSGTFPVAYSWGITGLVLNTTYYFCAIASNSQGTSFGAVLAFTTPASPPVVTTMAATLVTTTGATLNGSGNPGGAATTGWFRYSTTSPGTCNDSFGTRAPASGGASLGSGTSPVAYSQAVTGLSPATTYYFCAIASNSQGISFGSVVSFTTAGPPTVTTTPASVIGGTSAQLNGTANPNRVLTTGWFRYSTTNPGTCDDTFGTRAPASGGASLGSGSSGVPYGQPVTGLAVATTYYFCAIASNAEGTSFGVVLSFTTASAPTVSTSAATLVGSNSATLNGSANPNGAFTTGWFRYATTNPGTCNDAFGTRVPASGGPPLGSGTSPVGYSLGIPGLVPNTTYYFCAIASNSVGTSFGAVLSFTTTN